MLGLGKKKQQQIYTRQYDVRKNPQGYIVWVSIDNGRWHPISQFYRKKDSAHAALGRHILNEIGEFNVTQ